MADTTDLDAQIAQLEEQILYVAVNGQSRTVRGRSVTYPPLEKLQEVLERLIAKRNRYLPKTTRLRRVRG